MQRLLDDRLSPPLIDQVFPDPLFVHDQAGRFRAVNAKACASVGYSRPELLLMSVPDLEQDLDPDVARAALGAMRPGMQTTLLGRHRRKDGTSFPVEVRFGLLEADGERLYFASVLDISERQAEERTLIARLTQIRTVFDTMAEGLVLQDRDGRILDANRAAQVILGLTRDQLMGKTSMDADWESITEDGRPFPGEEHPAMVTLRTGQPVRGRLMGVRTHADGMRWISINSQPVVGDHGLSSAAVVTTFVDVTEQRRANDDLVRARTDLQALLDNVPAMIGYWNNDGTNRFTNQKYNDFFGLTASRIAGAHIQDVLGSAAYEASQPYLAAAAQGRAQSFTRKIRRHDGADYYHRVEYVPDLGESGAQGEVRGLYALVTDITALHESHEQIRRLVRRLESVREEERGTAARILHEGIAQDLFAARMTLDQLKSRLDGKAGLSTACEDLTLAIGKCIDATRQLANDLVPSALAHMRLSAALAEHAKYLSGSTPLRIEVREIPGFPELDDATRLLLFRAAQEALSNVIKHARASTVSVILRREGQSIVMVVADDGIGFTPARTGAIAGLGLLGLRESVAARGGELTVGSNDPGGTRLHLRVPLPRVAGDAAR